ncbi:MAG TPA: 4Fe-4S binding protein [Vicinamibacteria bacterium]|nr:4Fe-4S binding protein [Vicinamibacteria bacterium]
MLSSSPVRLSRALLGEVQAFVRHDGRPSTGVLKGPALRARRRRIEWSRHLAQGGFLFTVLLIGWEFARWTRGLERGLAAGRRPPGVEGFLPIASLLSLRHFLVTGEVHPVHPAGLVILLLAIGLGLLAKKAFCSWVCPIGTVSEILAALSRRLLRRRLALPRLFDLPLRSLKYLLLAFFLYVVFVGMDRAAVGDFLDSPYNRVADVKMLYFFERLSPVAATVLAGLLLLSVVVPYAWCRYLCPYGALLGALSLLSPLKITRHAPSCIDCDLCTRACPSRLPVARLARVRSDECSGCLSCVAACPVTRALRVEAPSPWGRAVSPAAFAALVVGVFVGGTLLARATGHWRNAITDREYSRRIQTIDSPAYAHDKGRVPSRREWEGAEARAGSEPAVAR